MSSHAILADYLDRAALATQLDVSPRTIIRYEQQPDGLPSTTIGGRKLYRIESVVTWLRSRETRPNRRRVAT